MAQLDTHQFCISGKMAHNEIEACICFCVIATVKEEITTRLQFEKKHNSSMSTSIVQLRGPVFPLRDEKVRRLLMNSQRNRTASKSGSKTIHSSISIPSTMGLTDIGSMGRETFGQRKRKTEKGQTELVYEGKRNSGDYVRLYRLLCVYPLSSGHFSVPANTHDSLCATVKTDEKESGTAYWECCSSKIGSQGCNSSEDFL
ncbi:hypothetical protein CEXT_478091 [Caerostris extrusa]|uniref:Uncharacterized protein n=1 Tax=Caerostris extrusa TaxID=172846 RepID=A0AAV4TMJ4_CAEEX|nr:hypothetical protein CEXT_478091 [Caerostris extrusa]